MSSNPYPLVVPCHRVVHADGSIGQYSAANGPATKAWLIEFEQKMLCT
jgi:methylated-DNA-[protein]-cysteine S-methyltransferase